MKDYYLILGVDPNSSISKIKKNYRKLLLKFHPDKNDGSRDFEVHLTNVKEAYSVLSDKLKRIEYDKRLKEYYDNEKQLNEIRRENEEIKRRYNDLKRKSEKEFRDENKRGPISQTNKEYNKKKKPDKSPPQTNPSTGYSNGAKIFLVFSVLFFVFILYVLEQNKSYNYESSSTINLKNGKPAINLDENQRITYLDSNWVPTDKNKAVYYRVAYYKDGKIDSTRITKDYYINGKIQFQGYFVGENPDSLTGIAKWYFKNGNLSTKRNYVNGSIEGESLSYFESGELAAIGSYKNDIPNGTWTYYFKNGKVESIQTASEEGLIEGENKVFYESGNLRWKSFYKKGKENGTRINYLDKNELVVDKTEEFKNDVRHGKYISYYKNGEKYFECLYKNGKTDGPAYYYYDNGKIKEKFYLVNDVKDGKYVLYYRDGERKESGRYENGTKVRTTYY